MVYAFSDQKIAIHIDKIDEAIKFLNDAKENKVDWIKIHRLDNIIVSIILEGEYQIPEGGD